MIARQERGEERREEERRGEYHWTSRREERKTLKVCV